EDYGRITFRPSGRRLPDCRWRTGRSGALSQGVDRARPSKIVPLRSGRSCSEASVNVRKGSEFIVLENRPSCLARLAVPEVSLTAPSALYRCPPASSVRARATHVSEVTIFGFFGSAFLR